MRTAYRPQKSLIRACDILKAFRDESECLRLSDVAARTGLHKTTVLRMLSTLAACEMLYSRLRGPSIGLASGRSERNVIDSVTGCRVPSSASAGL